MGKIDAVKVLIFINILFFIPTLLPELEPKVMELFALYFPLNENFKYWQIVTNMFMHGSLAHIFFNMYGLWAFGSVLEEIWGSKRFVVFYFLCGIGAALIYTLVNYYQYNNIYNELIGLGISSDDIKQMLETGKYNPQQIPNFPKEKLEELYSILTIPAVGASGAIYGILVAFGVLFPNAKLALIFLPVPIAAKFFVPILIAIDLFSGVTGFSLFGGGIAHFAHVGGALIGFLLMLLWKKNTIRPDLEN